MMTIGTAATDAAATTSSVSTNSNAERTSSSSSSSSSGPSANHRCRRRRNHKTSSRRRPRLVAAICGIVVVTTALVALVFAVQSYDATPVTISMSILGSLRSDRRNLIPVEPYPQDMGGGGDGTETGDWSRSYSDSFRLEGGSPRYQIKATATGHRKLPGEMTLDPAQSGPLIVAAVIVLMILLCCCRGMLCDILACVCLYEICCDDGVVGGFEFMPV